MSIIRVRTEPLDRPPYAEFSRDVTSAGDTVVAALSVALAGGLPLCGAVEFANIAAGIVFGRMGAGTATVSEIQAAIRSGRWTEQHR